jgi:hypothetical protein
VPVSVIPAELRDRPQWVCWRYETRDGKPTKVPYTPTGSPASSTDASTWFDFVTCSTVAGFDGVGYVFAPDDPYTGVDFDDCLDGDRLDPHVATHLLTLDSYTEISPSGRGVKTIVRAAKTTDRCRTSKTPWGGEFEVYDRDRFFAITGRHLRGTPTTIEPRQTELEHVLRHAFPKPETHVAHTNGGGVLDTDDEALLERARSAANGPKFGPLWIGDASGYGSESEADLALVSMLAFWTGPDPARIDRLFRRSGLMRAKWERDDYRARTIGKALERGEFYSRQHDERELAAYLEQLDGRQAKRPQPATGRPERSLAARPLSETPARAVTWLVDGLIPLGGLTLVAGVGGKGKTTWLLGVAARLSKGEHGTPAVALVVTYEDNVATTVRPRVEAAGGDVQLVKEIYVAGDDLDDVSLPGDVAALHDLVVEHRARLVIIDPIVAGVEMRYDTHKDRDVRVVLKQLRAIAEQEQCAIVIVGHLNKGASSDAYLRIGNSVAFYNTARSVLLVTEDELDRTSTGSSRR